MGCTGDCRRKQATDTISSITSFDPRKTAPPATNNKIQEKPSPSESQTICAPRIARPYLRAMEDLSPVSVSESTFGLAWKDGFSASPMKLPSSDRIVHSRTVTGAS